MFDFLYLPVDFRNSCNLGYSFVNFLSTEAMLAFYEAYHGKTWRGEESSTKVRGCAGMRGHGSAAEERLGSGWVGRGGAGRLSVGERCCH